MMSAKNKGLLSTLKKKQNRMQLARAIVQLLCLILTPAIFSQALSGVKSFCTAVSARQFLGFTTPMVTAIALLIFTFLFGRFFCGWICAFGAYTELIHALFAPLRKRLCKNKPLSAPPWAVNLKYGILTAILLMCLLGIEQYLSGKDPWECFALLVGRNPSLIPPIAGVLFALVTIGSIFYNRFYCRFFCPLGALFALVDRAPLFSIRKPRDVCGKCRLCSMKCPMGIELYAMDEVQNGECIKCMQCTAHCPRSNNHLSLCGIRLRHLPITFGAAAALLLFCISTTGVFSSGAAQTSAAASYTDGTYTGSGAGYNGILTVEVTVSGGKITEIEITDTSDDTAFLNNASAGVIPAVLAQQSTAVDTVSGATFSSNGILSAVDDALSKAQ